MQPPQVQPLTEEELSVFKAAGFPLASEVERNDFSAEELLQVVIRAMQNPNARYTEASAYALVKLAQDENLEYLPVTQTDEKTLRRLGYVLDSLAEDNRTDKTTTERLGRWAEQLFQMKISEPGEALALSDTMTKKRMKRLQSRATVTNTKWQVYGRVELREQLFPVPG